MKILTTIAAALLAGCANMGPTRLVMEADWRVAIDDLASIPCSEEGPACAFVKDYVRSGYSDAWLNAKSMEGGKRGELANRTRNAKAALMQRADNADHEAMSDGLFDAAILINSSPYIQRPPRTVNFNCNGC